MDRTGLSLMEITELEAHVMKRYYDDLKKELVFEKISNLDIIRILLAADAYKLALFVKYDMNPFEYDISIKNKRFEKRDES